MGTCGSCCGGEEHQLTFKNDNIIDQLKKLGKMGIVIKVQAAVRGFLARRMCNKLRSFKVKTLFDKGHLEINQENYNNLIVLVYLKYLTYNRNCLIN
jgi:hypothetical protein